MVADPHHFNGDPDPAFHFNVVPDPDPDPAPQQSDGKLYFEPLKLMHFDFNADPYSTFTLMRIRIQILVVKIML
jgi:hypothetical protein